MNPSYRIAVARRKREQGRMKAVLVSIDLILRYKPIDEDYLESLLWIRARLERNLRA